jgi:hypothetical protein
MDQLMTNLGRDGVTCRLKTLEPFLHDGYSLIRRSVSEVRVTRHELMARTALVQLPIGMEHIVVTT